MENQTIILEEQSFQKRDSSDQTQNLHSQDEISEKTVNLLSKENSEQQKIVIQSKKIQKKKYTLKQKQFEIKAVPNLSSIYDIESLFLVGEIFIALDFNDDQLQNTHISCLNNFKRIHQTTIHKQSRFLQIDMEYKVPSTKYFYNSALKLFNYPQQNIHELGQLLIIYQQFCFDIYENLQSLQSSPNLELFFNRQMQDLLIAKQTYLDNFKQDEFVYLIQMVNNIKTLEFEIQSIYVSEPLLILLGTNLEQYQRFVHRYGLNEYADSNTQINFIIRQLKYMLKMQGKYTQENKILQDFNEEQNDYVDVNLFTFDGIKIQAKALPQVIYPPIQNQYCSQFNLNSHMLIAVKTEIEPTSLKQILEIRQKQQNPSQQIQDNLYINEIDYCFDYSVQVEVFQEMAKLYNIFNKKENTRSSYRHINPEENDLIKHFNPDCPNLKYF
ncbi:hypothetical protein ABPG74_012677 [Tetrahymena malaccensis]